MPPATDGLNGELGGVGHVADADPSLVVADVVDAIRDGLGELTEGTVGEVMYLDPLGLAFGAPFGAAVGVVADQLLLFVSTLMAGWPSSMKVAAMSLR